MPNTKYHKKVFQTKAYKDKIYKYLLSNEIQDKILNSQLRREDYTNNDVYEFLTIIKRTIIIDTTIYQEITREEWSSIV